MGLLSGRLTGAGALTYGVLPSRDAFVAAFNRTLGAGERYAIKLNRSDARAADGTTIGTDSYMATELYKGVGELVAKGDDAALDLASSILSTLGIEWI